MTASSSTRVLLAAGIALGVIVSGEYARTLGVVAALALTCGTYAIAGCAAPIVAGWPQRPVRQMWSVALAFAPACAIDCAAQLLWRTLRWSIGESGPNEHGLVYVCIAIGALLVMCSGNMGLGHGSMSVIGQWALAGALIVGLACFVDGTLVGRLALVTVTLALQAWAGPEADASTVVVALACLADEPEWCLTVALYAVARMLSAQNDGVYRDLLAPGDGSWFCVAHSEPAGARDGLSNLRAAIRLDTKMTDDLAHLSALYSGAWPASSPTLGPGADLGTLARAVTVRWIDANVAVGSARAALCASPTVCVHMPLCMLDPSSASVRALHIRALMHSSTLMLRANGFMLAVSDGRHWYVLLWPPAIASFGTRSAALCACAAAIRETKTSGVTPSADQWVRVRHRVDVSNVSTCRCPAPAPGADAGRAMLLRVCVHAKGGRRLSGPTSTGLVPSGDGHPDHADDHVCANAGDLCVMRAAVGSLAHVFSPQLNEHVVQTARMCIMWKRGELRLHSLDDSGRGSLPDARWRESPIVDMLISPF